MSMKVCYAGYPVVRTAVPKMLINVPGERPVFKMASSHYRPEAVPQRCEKRPLNLSYVIWSVVAILGNDNS